jgi:hypothetical protein
MTSHYTRMDMLANALEKHPLFSRRNGEDFLLYLTHKDPKRVLGQKVCKNTKKEKIKRELFMYSHTHTPQPYICFAINPDFSEMPQVISLPSTVSFIIMHNFQQYKYVYIYNNNATVA